MSLYAVKNDEGKWLGCEIYCDEPDWFDHGGFIWDARSIAEENVKLYGGHVVELVEAPAKVVVSEEEAYKLERAKVYGNPADVILALAANHHPDDAEHFLRAYVIGWTVDNPKRWNVKVPHVDAQEGMWFFVNSDGKVGATYGQDLAAQFTAAEIDQYGLQDCEKVECDNDD